MSNTNPHRFPRPPTLPQSKIQVQSQREQGSVESGHHTSATIAGRVGGQKTFFGTVNEKEESDNPGTFATSFDLLSIAKVVPARQRRVSNPASINEGQVADTSTVGESLAESTGVYGDWRKLPSVTAKEGPPNPDTTKPMIFRRVAIPSSRLARHSSGIFASDKTNDIQDKQPATAGDIGVSTWRNSGFSFFENKNMPSPMEALKVLSGRDIRTSGSSQKGHSVTIYNLDSNLPPGRRQQDVKNDWIVNGDVRNHEVTVPEDNSRGKAFLGASGKIISPNTLFQTGEAAPPDSKPSSSAGFTQPSPPMVPVKNLNDSAAGILRAVAAPFEPKKGPSPDPVIPSKIRLEGSTSAGKIPFRLGPTSNPFAHLPGSFYKESTGPLTAGPVMSHGTSAQQLCMAPVHWKLEEPHRLSESSEYTARIPKDESSAFGTSKDTTHKKSSFSDVEISQLWDSPGSGDGSQVVSDEPPNLIGSNIVNFNPNAKLFVVPKTSSNPMPPPNKLRTGQIAVRDEAMEQIVPTPRKSQASDLQVVERLEIKAMVLSENVSDIVTALLEETSVDGHNQQPIVTENPVPQMDEHGRRGAISMQGTVVKRLENSDTGGGLKDLGLKVQMNKEPMEARTKEAWLESAGGVKIRIKEGGGTEPVDRYWPYPYPRHDVSAKEITTQLFVELNEQMVSYIRVGPDGIRLDHNWGRFELRKGKSGYPPGQEPWFGGDNTSFFDLSFGTTPSHNAGNVTIKPPPGLSLAPVVRPTIPVEMKTAQGEPGGLRDLVESSIPDYNYYSDDYKKLRARTLQEWNSTPISGSVPMNPFNSYSMRSRQGCNIPYSGQPVYEGTRGQIGGNGRSINSTRDSGMLGNVTLMNENRWGVGGQRDVGTPAEVEPLEERARRRKSEQRQCTFGAAGEIRSIVFGSDEGLDDV